MTTKPNAYRCEPAIQCANGRASHGRANRPVCTCGRGLKLEGSGLQLPLREAGAALPTCDKGYAQVSAAKARALKRQGYDIRTGARTRGQTIYCARPPQVRPQPLNCIDGVSAAASAACVRVVGACDGRARKGQHFPVPLCR